MNFNSLERRGFIALLGAVAIAGCTVTVPEPTPGQPAPQPAPTPQPDPTPAEPSIRLQNSFYSGRSGGRKIRAFVARSGSSLTMTSQTGKNFTENYANQGGNHYRAPSGHTINVTSTRSFVWNGPFGRVTMND